MNTTNKKNLGILITKLLTIYISQFFTKTDLNLNKNASKFKLKIID